MRSLNLMIVLILLSCSNLKKNSINKITLPQATTSDISSFFGIKNQISPNEQLVFYTDSTLIPVRWISVESEELKNSRIFKCPKFSVLILENPAESSISCFYKQKQNLSKKMIEHKHFPDSVSFTNLSDSLLVCEFYWKYDFGSDLSDIRKYYFIGEKTGFFKYGYTSVGKNSGLDLTNIVITKSSIMVQELSKKSKISIFSDTLQRINSSSFDFLSEPNMLLFNKVKFTSL